MSDVATTSEESEYGKQSPPCSVEHHLDFFILQPCLQYQVMMLKRSMQARHVTTRAGHAASMYMKYVRCNTYVCFSNRASRLSGNAAALGSYIALGMDTRSAAHLRGVV